MPGKPALVVVGHVGRDIIYVDGVEKCRCTAGAAYYAAGGAILHSNRVGLVTCICKDDKELYDRITRLGVEMDGIRTGSQHSPQFRIYYLSSNIRPRTHELLFGCGTEISIDSIPLRFLSAAIFHLGPTVPKQQLEWIKALRKRLGVKSIVSVDSAEPFFAGESMGTLLEIFELSDIVFLNSVEDKLLGRYRPSGKVVILKKGKDGAELWNGDHLEYDIPAPQVPFVDSTGSGDVLAGAFLALLSEHSDAKTALEKAVQSASESVSQYGIEHLINAK